MNLDYKKIFKELNKAKVDYLVVGGLAVNFHGIPRWIEHLQKIREKLGKN